MGVDDDAKQVSIGPRPNVMTDKLEMGLFGTFSQANRTDFPRSKTIHGLFEAQVDLTPIRLRLNLVTGGSLTGKSTNRPIVSLLAFAGSASSEVCLSDCVWSGRRS